MKNTSVLRFYPKAHISRLPKIPQEPEPVKIRTMEDRMASILQAHAKNADHLDLVKRSVAARERGLKNEYVKSRLKRDPAYKLLFLLRSRVRSALKSKGVRKTSRSLHLVGCSIAHLKGYIEKQFRDGMTWGNHGEWEIDHIRPCSSFDLTCREQQRQCFHFSNLQPLWRKDNRKKSNSWKPND